MARILIIDDETAIALMLKKIIEKAGFDARTAANGNEGMVLFDSFKPDLLITDIVMPEKEGLELIFELRRKNPKLKIIAISGGGRFQYEGYLNSAKHLGANKVYQKPLDLKELMCGISELLS